jgi:hypothetical protein
VDSWREIRSFAGEAQLFFQVDNLLNTFFLMLLEYVTVKLLATSSFEFKKKNLCGCKFPGSVLM